MNPPAKSSVGEVFVPPSIRPQTTAYFSTCTSRNWSEVTAGFLSRLWTVVVGRNRPFATPVDWLTHKVNGVEGVKDPTRKTGEALSPCVFVKQPVTAATARTARTAERGDGSFLISSLLTE